MKRPLPPPLVVVDAPESFSSEAYRVLRTNLRYAKPDGLLRRVVVSSATPGEGKSTTVANLGVCLAQAGQKILLVDADLRKPVLHTLFGRPKAPGLASYLVKDVPLGGVVRETSVAHLSIVPSGPQVPNPAELLGSNRMREFLDEAQGGYDLVLLDSAPVLAVSDVSALAPLVDGVIMVVGSGMRPNAVLRRAKAQLESVSAHVLAAVLNRFDPRASGYSSRYYGRYESYYQQRGSRHEGNAVAAQ